jgi:hypothetical protein
MDYLYFRTLQSRPELNFEIMCSPGLRQIRLQWPLIEQEVDYLVLKYRPEGLEFENLVLDLGKNGVQVDKLEAFTSYEIILGGCNKAGCGYSKPIFCQTEKNLPSSLALDVREPIEGGLIVEWSVPELYKNEGFEFVLSRRVLSSGLVYDSSFSRLEQSKKVVYSGKETLYMDKEVNFFTEYEYYVELNTIYGSVKSQPRGFKTRPSAPQLITIIGSLYQVRNDSVSLMIRPPLKMNGILVSVAIVLNFDSTEIKRELKHENLALLNESRLIEFLSNVTIGGLTPDTIYELRSKFCNQVSCLTSLQKIRFKTLTNERIEFFDAVFLTSNMISFKWNFKQSEPKQIR